MEINEIKNEKLSEKYYEIDHPSGLKIFVMPKEGYSSTYAIFGTKYGSIDNKFRVSDGEIREVPEGIAHFLEHKLFESEDLDAFERYAKTGADANAFTSFDMTCYLFTCTDNFKESLEILLDFVQSPYFTQQTVQKEQGIIGQEIKMGEDYAGKQVFFNLMKSLYHNHPVKIEVAGTVDSISKITADLLYDCYNTFYNLNNMVLVVVGNADANQVLETADKYLKKSDDIKIERLFEDEPEDIVSDYIEQDFALEIPKFILGYKENVKPGDAVTAKDIAATKIMLDIIAGDTSKLYKELLDKGVINTSFEAEYMRGRNYASIMFSGDSSDPKAVSMQIKDYIRNIKASGPDTEKFRKSFEKSKRKLYGSVIMEFNNVEYLGDVFVDTHFLGMGLFDEFEAYKNVTCEDAFDKLKLLDESKCALSVVKPFNSDN